MVSIMAIAYSKESWLTHFVILIRVSILCFILVPFHSLSLNGFVKWTYVRIVWKINVMKIQLLNNYSKRLFYFFFLQIWRNEGEKEIHVVNAWKLKRNWMKTLKLTHVVYNSHEYSRSYESSLKIPFNSLVHSSSFISKDIRSNITSFLRTRFTIFSFSIRRENNRCTELKWNQWHEVVARSSIRIE